MYYKIDNSRNGNCGPQSFAIGLFHIIQEEYKDNRKTDTYDRWCAAGLKTKNIRLQTILETPLKGLAKNEYLLNQAQSGLRELCYQAKKEELERGIASNNFEGTIIFNNFMELVRYFLKNPNSQNLPLGIENFNELALSSEVIQFAKETSKALQQQLTNLGFTSQTDDNLVDAAQIDFVSTKFLEKLTTNGQINPNSIILKGTAKITENSRWLTATDLTAIADKLNVELHFVHAGNKLSDLKISSSSYIILENLSKPGQKEGSHWVTRIATKSFFINIFLNLGII